jgi:tRNA threonylcarbamoyladenosine biosynthesis protein TsaE
MIVRTAEQMRALGARVAEICRPGDIVVLVGDLGAGKTTFVQGVGIGLGVGEPITSPTFVIARVHSGKSGTSLIHVDAYRLGSGLELDDLDLDTELACALTVIEWGEGYAERFGQDRLVISITALPDDSREVRLEGIGPRWAEMDLESLAVGP